MPVLGLIREEKIPHDSRVALTPAQCKWLKKTQKDLNILVQSCNSRCYTDEEYRRAGVEIVEDISAADILLGIKEVKRESLVPGKTYLFFSHTKKLQPYNRQMLQEIVKQKVTLIDYECLEHEDGTRIIGFGFFAGVVGAHNGMFAYGERTGAYKMQRINSAKNFQQLIHEYFGLKLPALKIAVTGSGRVAHGVLEIMNLLGIHEVEPEEYITKEFVYPVYVQLKGADLYERVDGGKYGRDDFHSNPEQYRCVFPQYIPHTDILMNGIYWEAKIPRLFEMDDLRRSDFRIQTIADITDDMGGSIPCNIGESTIAAPVYGVDKNSFERTAPYLPTSVDVMAVGNLPNELPRDASRYFGEQLIKFVLGDVINDPDAAIIDRATIIKKGQLNHEYAYMEEYARPD